MQQNIKLNSPKSSIDQDLTLQKLKMSYNLAYIPLYLSNIWNIIESLMVEHNELNTWYQIFTLMCEITLQGLCMSWGDLWPLVA